MTTTSISGLATSYNTTADDNYNVPTNPLINFTPAYTGNERLFSIILKDDSTTKDSSSDLIIIREPISSAGLLTEYSNLHATDGFSIRCYDSFSQTGLDLSSVTVDSAGIPTSRDYFVLIHSDKESMHHFARITKIVSADVTGDKFEFEPRLGDEIAKDVKFMVFGGPPRSDKIVAVSAGIKRQVANYVCSEPLFYFFEDQLDKKGELNHNTKYFVRTRDASSGSLTVLNQTNQNVACMTISDYRNKIIDYSKFSYHIDLVDKLRVLDDPDTATANESTALSGTFGNYHDYNDCFINARRDSDDDASAKVMTGPTRYVNYKFSPENNNYVPIVYELDVEDSYDAKAGFATLKLVDSTRNLSNKIFNNYRMMIKQKLEEEDLNEFVEVGEIKALNDASNREYELEIVVPKPTLYFTVNNEIMIGDRICIVDSIPSNTLIRLKTNSRLETEAAFTTSTSLTTFTAGTKIYRRRLNPLDNTYFTGTQISGDKLANLNLILQTSEYKDFFCDVGSFIANVDEEYGLLTITFENNVFNSDSALFYAMGSVFLYNEIFFGKVEQIDKTFENGQSIFEIQGRNTLSKLVDIVINKDTLFSNDVIYSSESPYNTMTLVGDASWDFDSKTITFTSSQTIADNTHLWSPTIGYIGKLNGAVSGTSGTLHDYPFCSSLGANLAVHKETTEYVIFNKALSSNKEVSSVTSLTGASDKGFYFRDGNKFTGNYVSGLDSSSENLAEGSSLVGLSDDTDTKAVGFNINKVDNLRDGLDFQLEIDGYSDSFINTLLDFTILEVKENNNTKTVKLAPYMPLTLGREQINYGVTDEVSFTNLATVLITSSNTSQIKFNPATFTKYDLTEGERIYINGSFVGIFIGYYIEEHTINAGYLHLDRKIDVTASDVLQISDGKISRSLHLTNGEHLHGNKIINMVGPNRLPIDYEIEYAGNMSSYVEKTYKHKFGSDYFRIYNLEKGRIGERKRYLVRESTNEGRLQPYYGDSIFRYYADLYKGNTNTLSHSGRTGSTTNNIHWPIEQRGIMPITGSNYVDRKLISSNEEYRVLRTLDPRKNISTLTDKLQNPLLLKDKLFQPDSKAARLFLFSNSDRLLYSSTRKDSLLNSDTRTISSYGLLSINSTITSNFSRTKEDVIGETQTATNLDEDYKHSNIVNSDKTLSSLKRFSLMRLTDVVYDWAFNPINTEYDVPSDRVIESVMTGFNQIESVTPSGATFSSVNYSTRRITLNANPTNVATGDILIDEDNRRVVGVVSSVSSADVTFFTLAKTNSGNLAYSSGDTLKIIKFAKAQKYLSIIGRGDEETSVYPLVGGQTGGVIGNDIHMLKGLFVGGNDTSSHWYSHYVANENAASQTPNNIRHIRKSTSNYSSFGRSTVMLPIAFQTEDHAHQYSSEDMGYVTVTTTDSGSDGDNFPDSFTVTDNNLKIFGGSTILNQIKNYRPIDTTGSVVDSEKLDALKVVNIKRYPIEFGQPSGIKAGTTTPFLKFGQYGYVFKDTVGSSSNTSRIHIYPCYNTDTEYGATREGAYLGFKLHLVMSGATNTTQKAIGNNTFYRNDITAEDENKFLLNVDLTGCYLVPAKKGKYYDGETVISSSSLSSNHDVKIDDNEIIYVVSHEYDLSVSFSEARCTIVTDKQLSNITYKIMQPNPTCFWDKSPQKIRLNTINSAYTKRMDSQEMMGDIPSFAKAKGSGGREVESNREGIQSMYVIVDMDNLSGENSTIVNTEAGIEAILQNLDGEFCISDGENTMVTSLKGIDVGDDLGYYLEFGDMKKIDGVASVSETFQLTVNGDIDSDSKRALIGTTVSITKEIEEIVEELLIENDIDFSLTKEDYKIFASPDFQGTNLFNVLNYLLSLKDKKMIGTGDTITIVNTDSSDYISKYFFTDNEILSLEVKKSNFDYFNEVAVYGRTHKAVRKDFRGVKKNGKKTLEVFEDKLNTQEDVEKEATRLLKIHTKLNEVIFIQVSKSNIKMLSVGDLVEIESKFSNVERNQFLILEMKHSLNGTIGLKLGKYIKGLEDTLANLLIQGNATKSYLRKKEFNINENVFDFFDTLKIKEMHLLIRKRETSGATLGFSTTLNTNANALGFGGAVTITRLLEEDL